MIWNNTISIDISIDNSYYRHLAENTYNWQGCIFNLKLLFSDYLLLPQQKSLRMSLGLLNFPLVTSLGNLWLPFLHKITISYPTGKILRYMDQNKTDLVYSVQIRCLLGADSVLLVEPESYLYSIRSSTISGTTRCSLGTYSVLGWNQRAISIQLGPPILPVGS